MAWTRTHDDRCTVAIADDDNINSLKHVMDPSRFYSCTPCRPVKGILGGNQVSTIKGDLVDLESDLQGIFRRRTRCPAKQYPSGGPPPSEGGLLHRCQEFGGECPRAIDVGMSHLGECSFFDLPDQPPPQPMFAPFECPGKSSALSKDR